MLAEINSKIKKNIDRLIKSVLSDEMYTRILFYRTQGYRLNLKSPQTFSEKIQWIKLNVNLEELKDYVDKYNVREYVKRKIGNDYLIPLIGVFKKSDEINFSNLPESFAIKATHASGWNILVRDKSSINLQNVKNTIDLWTNSSFFEITGERNYKDILGRVVIEEFIHDPTGDLKDYKFFCFNGQPRFIQLDSDRHTEHKRDLYDLDWNKINVKYAHENLDEKAPKPVKLREMIEIATKLSEDFHFVRVDLYYTNNLVLFGELTFTPGQGFEKFSDMKIDLEFGKHLNITSNTLIK